MKKVLILCGGRSDEHEISLISAKCVMDAIDRNKFSPLVIGIGKRSGIWHLEEEKTFYTGEFRADKIALNEKAPAITLAPYRSPQGKGLLLANGKTIEFDVVFPILHGPFGEDGTMQGLWDIVGVPYVGSHCGSSWNCMDKMLTKVLCSQNDIPVAPFIWIQSIEEFNEKRKAIEALGNPLFVKPARLGSSVGISKVENPAQLKGAVELALRYDNKVLIEKGIVGREIECGVLDNQASIPGEIIPSKKIGWYSYDAKYLLDDGAETVTPAKLTPQEIAQVQKIALRAFQVLECAGMARVDMFLEPSGKVILNEVNTIPGFTPISMYPKMWQASGVSYSDLITRLLELAK